MVSIPPGGGKPSLGNGTPRGGGGLSSLGDGHGGGGGKVARRACAGQTFHPSQFVPSSPAVFYYYSSPFRLSSEGGFLIGFRQFGHFWRAVFLLFSAHSAVFKRIFGGLHFYSFKPFSEAVFLLFPAIFAVFGGRYFCYCWPFWLFLDAGVVIFFFGHFDLFLREGRA